MDKKAIIQRALENINHPLSEITRRMTYRARSPGVAPVSGIKMALPKTSTMAKKMQKVLDDETPAGRKKQKQMANLVIGREEDDKEILLQFKTAASREKFRKLMNEDVQIDEEKSLFDISPTSSKWMKGRLRTGYNKSQKSGMPKEMFKKGQVIDLHPFDGDRFVGAKSPKDKGSYFFVAKRHVDAMNESVHLDEMKRSDEPFTVVAIKNNKVVGKAFGILHDEIEDTIQSMKEDKKGAKISVESKSGRIVHTESVQVDEAMAPFNPMGGGKRKPATNIGKDLRNQLQMTKPSDYSFSAPAADGGTFAVIPIKTSRPSSQAGVMMAIFDKRGKVSAYYGTHMDTDSAKKFAKKDGLIEDVQLDEATQHIVHVNVSRTGFRKLEAMIASLNGYRESDYSDGKARFYFDEKHDSAERKKVAEFINKTRGAEFSHAMKENVQLDEEVIKARVAFFGRPSKNNSDMRDAKKKNMFVDAKDVDAAKGKMFDVTFNSRRQFNRFESEYDFLMVKVFEDVQLDETNFRFPQPGEYYGDLGKSISDDPYYTMSKAELKKRSDEVDRKFASVMRKHKRTKVGEVLDLLDKDGGTKLYKDSDIKQISKYLTKFKDNVRKVAHEMLILVMQGDDYLAKKRIPVREDVQLDETMTTRDLESMIKGLKRGAKQEIADALNDMNLGGYGDYEARVDNVHKFKTKDLFNAMKKVMKLESLKMRLDERPDVPTYVIDRKTKKIVHGPTDTGDAKLFLKKQVQPRKFFIRQIRGAAKKVGDTV